MESHKEIAPFTSAKVAGEIVSGYLIGGGSASEAEEIFNRVFDITLQKILKGVEEHNYDDWDQIKKLYWDAKHSRMGVDAWHDQIINDQPDIHERKGVPTQKEIKKHVKKISK